MSVYLAALLEEMDIPIARNAFLQPQYPPYIVYIFSHSTNYAADSMVYLKRGNYQVELYTEKKDPALEAKLESLFDAHGLVYDKLFEFSLIIRRMLWTFAYTANKSLLPFEEWCDELSEYDTTEASRTVMALVNENFFLMLGVQKPKGPQSV